MQARMELLLVEDDPADAELMLLALRKERVASEVVHVASGELALDFLFCRGDYGGRSLAHPPRLVLLDLKMPRVDGLDVLRALKSDPRTCAIPVVVMTASDEERDVLRSYEAGVNSYIQKPVDFARFREVVRQLGAYWLSLNQPPPPQAFG